MLCVKSSKAPTALSLHRAVTPLQCARCRLPVNTVIAFQNRCMYTLVFLTCSENDVYYSASALFWHRAVGAYVVQIRCSVAYFLSPFSPLSLASSVSFSSPCGRVDRSFGLLSLIQCMYTKYTHHLCQFKKLS